MFEKFGLRRKSIHLVDLPPLISSKFIATAYMGLQVLESTCTVLCNMIQSSRPKSVISFHEMKKSKIFQMLTREVLIIFQKQGNLKYSIKMDRIIIV